MLKIFNANDKDFSTNGEKIIQVAKAKVHKEDNEAYYLDVETSLEYIDYIVANNIIVANTPTGDEPFRITNIERTRTKIKCRAYHIFYDSKNLLIADSYVVDKNCNQALDHLNTATDNASPFTTSSDVSRIDSFRCVRKSLYEAISTVLERWGGHLVRSGFNIAIKSEIGADNGVTIQYRKNLKSITCSENWDDVVTKILPVGKDGFMLPEQQPPKTIDPVIYDGRYVKYMYEDRLKYKITKTISFEQNIERDDYESDEAYENALGGNLFGQATTYVRKNYYPKYNYKVSAHIDRVTDIGDTVVVKDERLNVNVTTNVISFDYDVITKQFTNIELGSFQQNTLQNFTSNIEKITTEQIKTNNESMQVVFNKQLKEATDKIWGTIGSSYVIYEGDRILVVDELPKENAHNVMVINSNGIGFSQNGINGTFNSAWQIDGTLNMQNISVLNLTADLIKGGILKLGSNLNEYGKIELYDEENYLIGELNKNGFKMNGKNGNYVLMNSDVGFAGFDSNNTKIYWADGEEFHMKKAFVEEEITFAYKMRFLGITNENNTGIGIVPVVKEV